MKKKRSQSALIDSPGRWTGKKIFSKGGLTFTPNDYKAIRLYQCSVRGVPDVIDPQRSPWGVKLAGGSLEV